MSWVSRMADRPGWLAFSLLVVGVSVYQASTGQYLQAGFGILVAAVILLSTIYQPPPSSE